MEEKINVLMAVGSLGIGGNEQFVMNVFRNINKDLFNIDFVVFEKERLNYYDEIIKGGSQVYFCDSEEKNKLLAVFDRARKVKSLLKGKRYDIIHCNSCSLFGIFQSAIPGKLTKGVKVIAHAHNPGMPQNTMLDNILRCILKHIMSSIVDLGFSCSDVASSSKYTNKFINSDKHHIIHNAIDTRKFVFSNQIRHEIRKEWNIPEDALVIGHVGRFEQQKNHSFLLDIFSEYAKTNANCRLLLVGDGSLRKELEEKAKKLEIQNEVIFTGFQNKAERFYSAMDCVVMPSYYEGFPFVVVEAQINGLKCLLSDNITKTANITGCVKYLSIKEKSEKWCNMINSIAEDRVPQNIVSTIINEYDLEQETRRIENFYRSLVN